MRDLVKGLRYNIYYIEVDSRNGKAWRLLGWVGGIKREGYKGGRVIMTTNTLELEINIPNIRVILYIGGLSRYQMEDYR